MKNRLVMTLAVALLITGLTACQDKNTSSGNSIKSGQLPPPSTQNKMAGFSGEAELESYLRSEFSASPLPRERYGTEEVITLDSNNPVFPASGGAAESFSETNVQEQGVDESDKVKTDGQYFYITQGQTIRIVAAVPANAMKTVSRIQVGGSVDALYLFKDMLIALYTPENGTGHPWGFDRSTPMPDIAMSGLPYWIPVKAKTGVLVVDISDAADPKQIQNTVLEGNLAASRLVDGKLHLVMRFLPELPPLKITYDGTDEDFKAVVETNKQLLSELVLGDFLPDYEQLAPGGGVLESGELLGWQDLYRPALEGGGSLITVTTFDLKETPIPFHAVGLVADVHTLYASTQAIYLAATHWKNEPFLADSEIPGYDLRESTKIHKLDISGDKAIPVASGSVWGRILNQFSLGEHEDVLRIATTTGFANAGTFSSRNHVFTLQASDENLEIIGKIENIAPGEDIYSARFIGDRGFLVTFVKVDPLFTIDLSNPANPKIMGELKVPGYSDYIHPLGENHLITIGKDAREEGGITWYQGLQLSIFDVTDFSNPQLLHQEKLGDRGTHSEALYNHKAFTFWEEEGLLALPVQLYKFNTAPTQPWEVGEHLFSGLYVYDVGIARGFDFLGRIKTSSRSSWWTRGIFIEDTVYAVQEDIISSAKIDDIADTINTLPILE